MKVHINESSVANILYFAEVASIVWVNINMDMYNVKVINVHIKDGKIIHFKACADVLFYTNIYDLITITNPTNIYLNSYSYLSTVKQISDFLLIMKLKERRNFKSYRNVFTGQERQILRLNYNN